MDDEPLTYTEYAAIEERVELISGEVYAMSSPSADHQDAVLDIGSQLKSQLKGKPCKPFIAPLDVRLFYREDDLDTTVVQPDVMIVCDPGKIAQGFIKGAPDFILEILSASTGRMDMLYKANIYARAGVREYWILSIEERALHKGTLSDDAFTFTIVEAAGTVALNTLSLSINFDEIFPRIIDDASIAAE
jgi:Uma2 family endonuclease